MSESVIVYRLPRSPYGNFRLNLADPDKFWQKVEIWTGTRRNPDKTMKPRLPFPGVLVKYIWNASCPPTYSYIPWNRRGLPSTITLLSMWKTWPINSILISLSLLKFKAGIIGSSASDNWTGISRDYSSNIPELKIARQRSLGKHSCIIASPCTIFTKNTQHKSSCGKSFSRQKVWMVLGFPVTSVGQLSQTLSQLL